MVSVNYIPQDGKYQEQLFPGLLRYGQQHSLQLLSKGEVIRGLLSQDALDFFFRTCLQEYCLFSQMLHGGIVSPVGDVQHRRRSPPGRFGFLLDTGEECVHDGQHGPPLAVIHELCHLETMWYARGFHHGQRRLDLIRHGGSRLDVSRLVEKTSRFSVPLI